VTIDEYEERFRPAVPSLHQTFAESQGPGWQRLRKRRLQIVGAILAIIAMATEIGVR
jgi:hypothetical protein